VNKKLVALAILLCVALGGAALAIFTPPEPAHSTEAAPASNLSDFSHWAVVLVAGDYRAHSGAPSKVFDNALHDLAAAFGKIGFNKANIQQFSVDYADGTQHASGPEIATAMQGLTARASDGCLIYFTSHGTPQGIVIGDAILGPNQLHDMVASACGNRPSVIIISSCYSGQFVAPLQGDNRIVMTAARPDRTSFGCGELDHYTFFDDCVLRALPLAGDFPGLGGLTQQCVAERERLMKATPPSEPQVNVGPNVVFTLRWRDMPAPAALGNQPT